MQSIRREPAARGALTSEAAEASEAAHLPRSAN